MSSPSLFPSPLSSLGPPLRARLLAVAVALVMLCGPLLAVSTAEAALRSRLSVDWGDTTVRVGQVVTVRGHVRPARDRRAVRLQRRADGRWVTVARRRTRGGDYRLRDAARLPGRYTYRVRVARTSRARAATGGRTAVRVRARGNPRAYAFISRSGSGDPIARWNPCRRIGYRVNARQGGRGALGDARQAVARIRRVTGLRLVYQGRTRIIPGGRGDDGRYPRDTDLVVAWAKPSQTSYLDGRGVAGMGGPWWTSARDERGREAAMITRGFAVLNAEISLEGGFGRGPRYGWQGTRGQLLMHEIGHAIGLGHPRQDDRWEILYPTLTRKRAVWGAGDLRGLRRLGAAQGCLSTSGSYRGFAGPTTWHEHLR